MGISEKYYYYFEYFMLNYLSDLGTTQVVFTNLI